jgi:glycosyltransferase involved in cell wall biosynthesis
MMDRPELIAFSEHKVGGVQNFYYNILGNDPTHQFDIKWIFHDNEDYPGPRPLEPFGVAEEIIIKMPLYKDERIYSLATRLQKLISNRPGVVLTNFPAELYTLHLFRRNKKTIYFICHDENYVPIAQEFSFLIDVFIAHNICFYDKLVELMPERKEQIYFIPYGVSVPMIWRQKNETGNLKIVIAARLHPSKGIMDIPVIDELLQEKGVQVEWTIIGDGHLKEELRNIMAPRQNCSFHTPANNSQVLSLMQQNDVFILPSRLDGLPVAMLEAMSVGCVPVISEFNAGIKMVVTEDVGFVLPVGDNEAFANTIAQLHTNRNDLEKRSDLARKKVETQYNIKIRAAEYFQLFANYKSLKQPFRKRSSNYGGLADHPAIPAFIRVPLKKIKKVITGV